MNPNDNQPSAPAPRTPQTTNLHQQADLNRVTLARELFWQNVIREMLTSLSVLSAKMNRQCPQPPAQTPEAGDSENVTTTNPPPPNTPPPSAPPPLAHQSNLFDGRLAVITTQGQRIPISQVFPLFACGIGGTESQKNLSLAVECTVFQIRTPGGEVFTLPLHEIRSFHALTEEIMSQLASEAMQNGSLETDEPFGFAAFTSLARDQDSQNDPYYPDPDKNAET